MYKLAGVIWNDDGTPATFKIGGRMSGKTPNIKPTPLEALEELKFQIGGAYLHTHDLQVTPYQVKETCLFEVIEDALKDYELMKQAKIVVVDKKIIDDDLDKLKNQRMLVDNLERCEIKPLFDEKTQKSFKALEILKWKKVDIYAFRYFNDNLEDEDALEAYNEEVAKSQRYLTREEFDLLKEVLS